MKSHLNLFLLALILLFGCKGGTKAAYQDKDNIVYPRMDKTIQSEMYADTKIVIEVDKLERATKSLPELSIDTVFQKIIHVQNETNFENLSLVESIIGHYNGCDSLVYFENQSFLRGAIKAYNDHRPFVISPDAIWLLITQGFANHVANNAEDLRSQFVDFEGKARLEVRYDANSVNLMTWDDLFSGFPKMIAEHTNKELITTLTSDFTTTTVASQTASAITIMSAFDSYFDYYGAVVLCGIPEIILEGTPEDWNKILTKAEYLRKYKLDWWIDELMPVLDKIKKSAEGDIDKEFWRNMVKYEPDETCGLEGYVDGWIVKLFPYFDSGNKRNLEAQLSISSLTGTGLPSELVKVDLTYHYEDGDIDETVLLEIWAGFIGLRQDKESFALKPEIGWFVKKKDEEDMRVKNYIESEEDSQSYSFIVDEVPKELLSLKEIRFLFITFRGDIIIPNEMKKIKIRYLALQGEIDADGIKRICKMFPNTGVLINGVTYRELKE